MSAKARFENDIKHTRQASNNKKAMQMLDIMNEYFPEYGKRSDDSVNGYHHAYFLAKMWLFLNR